jgi:hypothetical protein
MRTAEEKVIWWTEENRNKTEDSRRKKVNFKTEEN